MDKEILKSIQEAKTQWETLHGGAAPLIMVGNATCGRSAGSQAALETFHKEIEARGLDCHIMEVGCIGLCYAEPIVCIFKPEQPGVVYDDVTPKKANRLVEEYLLNDNPLPDDALGTLGEGSIEGIPGLHQAKKPEQKFDRRFGAFDHWLSLRALQ